MDYTKDRKFVGRLVMDVLTEKRNVRETIKLFPETKDESIICAYHALVHYEADEDIRYKDMEYRDAQDDYLEMISQTLCAGKALPKNIINEYKPYYKDKIGLWKYDIKSEIKEFIRSVCSF